MRLLGKTAMVLGVAGAMALGSMTTSEARSGRNAAAIAGGVIGFAAGAAIGSAAANAGYYGGYGYDSYAYAPAYSAYDSYAYAPTYVEQTYVAPVAPAYTPPSYYGPVTTYGGFNTNYTGPWQERRLQGREW